MKEQLLGTWEIDTNDERAVREFGNVSLRFSEDGTLTYVVHSSEKDEVILMTYEVEGNVIVSTQPSAPRVERTRFEFIDSNVLRLRLGDLESTFLRIVDHRR